MEEVNITIIVHAPTRSNVSTSAMTHTQSVSNVVELDDAESAGHKARSYRTKTINYTVRSDE